MTTTQPPQQIRNPRRLLILTPSSHSHTTIPALLHRLTDVPVEEPPATFAGYTTHAPLRLANKYYTAEIPIWVDEIPLAAAPDSADTDTDAAAQWRDEFSSSAARVVRDAIGAVLVCVRRTPSEHEQVRRLKEFVAAVVPVKDLMEEERGGVADVPGVLMLVGSASAEKSATACSAGDAVEPFSVAWWEDQLVEMGVVGFEVLEWDSKVRDSERRNRYGEYQGMRRVKEILETHEWSAAEDAGSDSGPLDEDDLEEQLLGLDGEGGFNLEVDELEREMLGLRMAIEHGGGDATVDRDNDDNDDDGLKVESLEALMMRMQAIRDMSAELPEGERKKFAAKAIRDIMKEL